MASYGRPIEYRVSIDLGRTVTAPETTAALARILEELARKNRTRDFFYEGPLLNGAGEARIIRDRVEVKWTCKRCGGVEVQVSLPTWCDANDDYKPVDVDIEAKELDVWCARCDESTEIEEREQPVTEMQS